MPVDKIKIIGAREHNLKNVTVEIEKNKLVVITGPSGSGKSSLALDTLYAEGKRRYIESLSSYARQFLGMPKRPDVDKIEGICPAIAIDQKTVGFNPRSTVGTITEVYDYLRVLFARLGQIFCPSCDQELRPETPDSVVKSVLDQYKGQAIYLVAPIVNSQKGEFKDTLKKFFKQGYDQYLIDNQLHRFLNVKQIGELALAKTYKHTISIVLDVLTVQENEFDRIFDTVKKSFQLARGLCGTATMDGKMGPVYSINRMCAQCSISVPEVEPRIFSFNSPVGACPSCNGLGIDNAWRLESFWKMAANKEEESGEEPEAELEACRACHGSRLKKEALCVRVGQKNIYQLSLLSLSDLREFFAQLHFVQEQEIKIADRLVYEIRSRLQFLVDVGLHYLNLSRSADTLSGGESQRIRLATQVGCGLAGVLYILDEPSIGLHQRDNDRLIETLKRLRDAGNSVVVVEHDLDTMLESDYIIDMGPGAGVHGGEIVAQGTVEELKKCAQSLTGRFLAGTEAIKVPVEKRKPAGYLEMVNATKNNLKHVNVKIPLGVLCAISGVSGSGKSSLIIHTLAKALQNHFYSPYLKGSAVCAGVEKITGVEQLENMVFVDQKSIGRTPRSNPATYLGIFNNIRTIFANLPESKARGYQVGSFSFNVDAGRCQECRGEGIVRVSMQFLEDVIVTCKLCEGRRYNQDILNIKFRHKNIFDILSMSCEEAVEFFADFPAIARRVKLMCDVGLDYITLGQPCNTISGGESQRIKLVNELSKRNNRTLYILDEPTTGLHFSDIEKLIATLNRLVERNNSVLVIEHNLDMLKVADYIIDVGPEGGINGGEIVFAGLPEKLAECKNSFTGKYLKKIFV